MINEQPRQPDSQAIGEESVSEIEQFAPSIEEVHDTPGHNTIRIEKLGCAVTVSSANEALSTVSSCALWAWEKFIIVKEKAKPKTEGYYG